MASILSFDIGGSSVAAALVDGNRHRYGRIVEQPLRSGQERAALEEDLGAIAAQARELEPRDEVQGVGVALPGPTDYLTGTSWMEHKLTALRGRSVGPLLVPGGVPWACVNDADAFALGELSTGAGRGTRRALYLTLGTGLGSCFVDDGVLLEEGEGVPPGGELWNEPFGDGGETIEQQVGRAALERWYRARGGDPELALREVARRAASGDTLARELFAHLGRTLAVAVAGYVRAFAPERIVLGGSIARSSDLFIHSMARALRDDGMTDIELGAGALGDAANLVGAAIALQRRFVQFERRRVIYLHGFASNPQSPKAQAFARAVRAEGGRLERPDLNADSFRDLTISRQLGLLEQLTEGCEPASVVLIGSSLGGYTASLFAARSNRVAALVLMAPAFDFGARWAARQGPEAMRRWKQEGTILTHHYGRDREEPIGYGLMEDVMRHPPYPDVRVPTLVIHGKQDDVVDPIVSETFADARPNVDLALLNAEHTFAEAIDPVVDRAMAFLRPWLR